MRQNNQEMCESCCRMVSGLMWAQRLLFVVFVSQSKSCDPSPHFWQTASAFLWGDPGHCFRSTVLLHIINYGLSPQHIIKSVLQTLCAMSHLLPVNGSICSQLGPSVNFQNALWPVSQKVGMNSFMTKIFLLFYY